MASNPFRADEGGVGVGTPVEEDDHLRNGTLDFFPKVSRKDEEKADVGEEGNDEDIDVQDARGGGPG